ncbi:MAG TPA: glycosyltransferase, partial [Tepidisphaeraceae bacterium]|nr:glycosyltransferase [Tepidisphaeraceae bacterium]
MFSVIICSRDNARFRIASEMYSGLLRDRAMQVVRVADARSLAEGYNRALRHSRGDIVLFSHDDVEILGTDFGSRLEAHLERFDIVGVAGTTRLIHPKWSAAGMPYLFGQVAYPL